MLLYRNIKDKEPDFIRIQNLIFQIPLLAFGKNLRTNLLESRSYLRTSFLLSCEKVWNFLRKRLCRFKESSMCKRKKRGREKLKEGKGRRQLQSKEEKTHMYFSSQIIAQQAALVSKTGFPDSTSTIAQATKLPMSSL